MRKQLNFFFIFILLISSIYATEECKSGVITTEDIPCIIFYPISNTSDCGNITISHYSNNSLLFTQSLTRFNSVYCNSTFNISSVGTYAHKWSTGDTGSFVVEKGDTMIYLLYFVIMLIIGLFIAGFWLQDVGFLGVGGLCLMAFAGFVYGNGFNGIYNTLTQIIAIIGGIMGFYIMIRAILEMSDLNNITFK